MAIHHLLAAVTLAAASGMGALADARLPDQRGGSDSLVAHRGNAVVVVVVDARRLGTVRKWEQDLLTRFPKLHVLTVADVNETRPTTVERVSSVLAKRVPPEVAVLIDIERLWAHEFALDTAAPNLILFDAGGAVVARFRGRYSAELAAEVSGQVGAMGGVT